MDKVKTTVKRKEFRSLSIEELEKKEKELRIKIFEKQQQETGKKGLAVEKPHLYNEYRKDIARIKTIIAEKKNNII